MPDELDLPRHEQSGNLDRGQIALINQREEGEQAGALESVLETYYRGETDFNEVFREISELGYTQDRTRQIRSAAQVERTIRNNIGHPSDLSPNQLNFLQRYHSVISNRQFAIHTDGDGRQYVDDNRVREDDGTPSRLYLPEKQEYNALTIAQQEEQQRRLDDARPDFLQDFQQFNVPPIPFGQQGTESLSNSDIETIDSLSGAYLESDDPDALGTLRDNLSLFITAPGNRGRNVIGINDILNQYMIDIQYEKNFRENNNGRPQLLTQEQYDILRNHPEYNWDGGNIYENDRGVLYYRDVSRGNRVAVPNRDPETGEIFQGVLAQNVQLPLQITLDDQNEDHDPSFNIRPQRSNLSEADQARLRGDMADAINGRKEYPDFLDALQRQYSLSNSQFIAVAQEVSRARNGDISYEDIIRTQAYVDSPLYFYEDGDGFTFTRSRDVYSRVLVGRGIDRDLVDAKIEDYNIDFQVTHTAVQTSLTVTPIINPTLNILEQIRLGTQTQEQIDDRFLERPRPYIQPEDPPPPLNPYRRPPREEGEEPRVPDILEELAAGELSTEAFVPPEIFQGSSGNPPIVPGTTGSFYRPPEQDVRRYEQFFNDNQSLYFGFRNTFRDILPVFTGAIGGYFAFSLAKAQERGTIQTILREERLLLDGLEARLQQLEIGVGPGFERVDRLTQEFNLEEDDLAALEANRRRQIRLGGVQPTISTGSTGSGVSGPATPPQTPGFPLRTQSDIINRRITAKKRELIALLSEVRTAESELDSLEMDIENEILSREQINERIDNLITLDRQIMESIYRYNPQILTGFQIGQTIGLVLSGYFFPTYASVEYETALDRDYNPNKNKQEKKKKKHSSSKPQIPFNIQEPKEIRAGEGTISKRQEPLIQTFIPQKANSKGKPLSYREIQDLKSTLNQEELRNLQGKHLIFGENNNVVKINDKCKSVVQQIQINKIPIKI